ncbi:papain family cysteine protease [Oesophagostomum dentatum]|uniref:Papain family cysteine protease n=1 Tax=Oesophagostomum dentatum TaxID=61180 RepID=A0A0B1TV95_OESDE|nr:papain family cysteine protease [Oesophagostomum dentatum]
MCFTLGLLVAVLCVCSYFALPIVEFKARSIPAFAKKLEGQDLVDYVNNVQSFFEANITTEPYGTFKSRLMDIKYLEVPRAYGGEINDEVTIPESFDAREQWPQCDSIKLIRDQANCGSCWAVASASAMSDRLCVQSKGKIKTLISDTDILSCCTYCGKGCQGGYAKKGWEFVVNSGASSGGPYGQKDVCKPYAFHPCGYRNGQPYYGECRPREKTPACKFTCQKGYKTSYQSDKIMAKSAYYVTNSVEAIQKEIMTNGPVQASFIVYSDFRIYKSGVYVHTAGKEEGGHAVRIIGWGTENGVPYWLITNSWNTDWGENGLFRMLRGSNECLIEQSVVAGIMDV